MPLIYVINLDKDIERMKSVAQGLDLLGLSFKRIPAVLGKEIPRTADLIDEHLYQIRNRLASPRAGEIGCYLSHIKAMNEFMHTNEPWCDILEDDVEILKELPEVLKALSFKNDWDLVKLFCFHSGMPFRTRKLTNEHNLVIHFTRTTSSAAYAINRKAAATLIKTLLPISEQIDHALERPWETGLRIRGIRPLPVILAPVSAATTIGYNESTTQRRIPIQRVIRLFLSRANKEIQRFLNALKETSCYFLNSLKSKR